MKYDIITFDCYGTLIDWESGIAEAFHNAGIASNREKLMEAYHREEPAVEKTYRNYREVLTETADRVAAALGKTISSDQAEFLPDSLPSWKPFADTNAALESLRRQSRLGILSNVDDDLLAETLRHFTVDFEILITAQQVRSYKPAPAHFMAARKRIGSQSWLHAAQSYFHDIVPASGLGIPTAWINRKTERPTGTARATAEFRTLEEFALSTAA
jgi:2-haloalkanoic acid dehalogenase type II